MAKRKTSLGDEEREGYQMVGDVGEEEEMPGLTEEHTETQRRETLGAAGLRNPISWFGNILEKVDHGGVIREHCADLVRRRMPNIGGGFETSSRGRIGIMVALLLCLALVMIIVISQVGDRRALREVDKDGLVRMPSMCAESSDLYDARNHRCRLSNALAYGALALQDWVTCDVASPEAVKLTWLADMKEVDDIHGLTMKATMDEAGRFWYPVDASEDVKRFYSTCKPSCANAGDWYDRTAHACVVGDAKALKWLSTCLVVDGHCLALGGSGLRCDDRTKGYDGMRKAAFHPSDESTSATAAPDSTFIYDASLSSDVRALYDTCTTICAQGDEVLKPDPKVCRIHNDAVIHFLEGRGGVCNRRLPGFSAISLRDPDRREYVYQSTEMRRIRSFYQSCE